VSLILEDGSVYAEQGTLQFSDITVDQSTGTVTLRAIFPNKQLALLPGMFVHARIEAGVNTQAILVPQQSVSYDQQGQATALVIGSGEKVEVRPLKIERAVNNQWLVAAGLQPGDRVVVSGLQKVRPGAPVQAIPVPDGVASTQPVSAQRLSNAHLPAPDVSTQL
jgi:membrane fusion protein (multidrug efflux system)